MATKYNSGKNHPKFIDLQGKIIGNLTVLEYMYCIPKPNQSARWLWKCVCNCGSVVYIRTTSLTKTNPQTSCKKCADKRSSSLNILPGYASIKNRVLRRYKRGAKLRGYEFALTTEQFNALLFQDCFYCGSSPVTYLEDKSYYNGLEPLKRNGIDRLDNTKGYLTNNVVTCCSKCNTLKMDLPFDEFKSWIDKIHSNLKEKSSTTSA